MQPETATRRAIAAELRDGLEVHRAALAHGLDVVLLPRQVMILEAPGAEAQSFIHGIPQRSTLAGVTFAQDRRMRRALLAGAGFTVPKGATFSVGRSPGAARRYAERLGYPVVAKPALGDNTIEVFSEVADDRELKKAIAHFRKPPESRRGHVKAAYALTELREPGMRNGKPTAPLGYRFLVEQHVPGQYLRFLVLDGEVRNVLLCADGPWRSTSEELRDVTDEVHQSLRDLAVAVTRTMTGVALAAVDVVVPDHTAAATVSDVPVVEFSERPWLAVQHALDPELSAALGETILGSGAAGMPLSEPSEAVRLEVRIDGCVDPADLLRLIERESEALGLAVDLEVSDPAMGHITGTMAGSPADIAWLMESLVAGSLTANRPMLVEARQDKPER